MHTASSSSYRRHPLAIRFASRARLAAAVALVTALLSLTSASAFEWRDGDGWDDHWVTTWGASPQSSAEGVFGPPTPPQFSDQTMRMIARISVGGDRVRVRLNNGFSTSSVVIGEAHIARHAVGGRIDPGSDRRLMFGGSRTILKTENCFQRG